MTEQTWKTLTSSRKSDWETPKDVFDPLYEEFKFTLDVCATDENAKCERYFTEKEDGLKQDWNGVCWMNPPYGNAIAKWMKKAYDESQKGSEVVCLVPSRTDTKWWHDYAMKADEIRYIRGRIRFVGAEYPAPFPSAVVVFRGRANESPGTCPACGYIETREWTDCSTQAQ